MEIVIASSNLHKIREFRNMFRILKGIDVLSLHNFPAYTPLHESGNTFQEVAALKACHASNALKKMVIADDTGLVVPALDGAPGIHSHRYAGDDATDAENRKKLLEAMRGLGDMRRSAYLECCLVLASPKGVIKTVTGISEGRILHEERGRNGFGYDPLFIKHEYDKTFGEMDETTKNRISHRRKAFEKLLPTLEAQLALYLQEKSCTTSSTATTYSSDS